MWPLTCPDVAVGALTVYTPTGSAPGKILTPKIHSKNEAKDGISVGVGVGLGATAAALELPAYTIMAKEAENNSNIAK
jgi:hypothetical protein